MGNTASRAAGNPHSLPYNHRQWFHSLPDVPLLLLPPYATFLSRKSSCRRTPRRKQRVAGFGGVVSVESFHGGRNCSPPLIKPDRSFSFSYREMACSDGEWALKVVRRRLNGWWRLEMRRKENGSPVVRPSREKKWRRPLCPTPAHVHSYTTLQSSPSNVPKFPINPHPTKILQYKF